MKANWWEKFFESNFASLFLERDKTTLQRNADFLMKKLKLAKGSLVFDQCCGIGNVAQVLAKKGIRMVGVDQSALYIKIARKRTEKENLPCKFYQSDALRFVPHPKCDGAFNWYTSFGYSRKDEKNAIVLKRAYQSLKKGGYFALDYYNISHVLRNFAPVMKLKKNFGGKSVEIQRISKIDLENGLLISKWRYKYPGQPIKEFGGETRTYSPSELKKMLLNAGFRNIKFFGDIYGRRLTLDSPRCIIVSQKPR